MRECSPLANLVAQIRAKTHRVSLI